MKYLLVFNENNESQGLNVFSENIDLNKEIKKLNNNYKIVLKKDLVKLLGEEFLDKASYLYLENDVLIFDEEKYTQSNLNKNNIPYPDDGQNYVWNEEEQSWELM